MVQTGGPPLPGGHVGEMGSGFAVSERRQPLGGGADTALLAVGLWEQAEHFQALGGREQLESDS